MNEQEPVLHRIALALERLADRADPPPADIVGTRYVADRLGCTTAWISQLINDGEIPEHCVVRGTGHGKPWKFQRRHIDEWINRR